MAMTANMAQGEFATEINTTPLIDVMLVLLTLLILTLPIQTHGLPLDLPRMPAQPLAPPPAVDLRIDFDGHLFWNDVPVDRGVLDSYFVQTLNQVPEPEIHIRANALAHYDVVARTLGDAQRLGITKIGFADVQQFGG